MTDKEAEIEAVLNRVEETLQTAMHGLDDLLAVQCDRRMSGLRNLIVFGRSVTFVLQNLRSVVDTGDFDASSPVCGGNPSNTTVCQLSDSYSSLRSRVIFASMGIHAAPFRLSWSCSLRDRVSTAAEFT